MVEVARHHFPGFPPEVLAHREVHAVPDKEAAVVGIIHMQPFGPLNGHAEQHDGVGVTIDRIKHRVAAGALTRGCGGHPHAEQREFIAKVVTQHFERCPGRNLEADHAPVWVGQLRPGERRADRPSTMPARSDDGLLAWVFSAEHDSSLCGVAGGHVGRVMASRPVGVVAQQLPPCGRGERFCVAVAQIVCWWGAGGAQRAHRHNAFLVVGGKRMLGRRSTADAGALAVLRLGCVLAVVRLGGVRAVTLLGGAILAAQLAVHSASDDGEVRVAFQRSKHGIVGKVCAADDTHAS